MNLSPEIKKQLNELSGIDQRIKIESQVITHSLLIIPITIDKSLINFNSIEPLDIIRFIILIKPTYPNIPPQLYCVSKFCVPELCDARDLLEDTLQMKWDPKNCFLKLVLSQIPSFIQRYLFSLSNNKNEIVLKREMFGKYYLDSIYEKTLIKYLPYLYFDVISEVTTIKGKTVNMGDRKILITENFLLLFCNKGLYELEQLNLVFVGPITSLVYIRQFIKDEKVLLRWMIKGKGLGKNNYYEMQLRTSDGDYIVDTLIKNLSKSSINFKVTNKVNGNIKREGSVPMVDINLVEEKIKLFEKKINTKENITKENISVLINLYEKAIQYYSALNDKRFEIYIKKIHNIYSNNEYTSLLNKKTFSKAKNQYNVTHFKRKRKKKTGNEKEDEDKNINKNIENQNIKNDIEKDIINKEKEEDKKEENINNINNINKNNNENEQKVNDKNKNEINEENKNELINKINDNKEGDINKDKNNIINEKEDEKDDNKKEINNPSRPKRNLRKREEGSSSYRKNRTEINNNNLMESANSQRMLIDKKEIEEMIKNELNINIINNNEETKNKNNINDNKDKGNNGNE